MAIDRALSIMHIILEPRYSGAEILVRELVRIQRNEGHQTSIAAFRPAQQDFVPEITALEELGCQMYLPAKSLTKWRRVKAVLVAVRDARPDIVFAHSILPSIYARLALRLQRRPAIVTVLHTDDDLSDPGLLRIERFLWRRNACVVGVSPKSIQNYQRRMTDKVSARVVRNGIRPEHFAEFSRNSRMWRHTLYGPPYGDVIVVQVGRICLQKQQHVSVEALSRLRAKGIRNLRLVLVGPDDDPGYKSMVISRVREGGVGDQIRFAGPQANIGAFLAGADVFLMPSAWEAHPIAALEGLASGVFCVFSQTEAFEEFRAHPGVAMIGAPPEEEELAGCLEGLVKSKALERRYERDLGSFSIAACAAEYMKITRDFVDSGSHVPR